jgi:uncharacterized membrane protein
MDIFINKEHLSDVYSDISTKIPNFIITAFSLVAALAWNNAINSMIDYYTPEKYKNTNNYTAKLIYALALSIVIIIIIAILSKITASKK